MKTIRDVMTVDVVWVGPTARVRTAVILVKGHKIGALPVMDSNEQVVGIVTCQELIGEADDLAITEIMDTKYVVVPPDMTVIEAADIMQQNQSSHLIVQEDGHLVGIVSHADMLTELGKTFDPLTGLPWSDTFREWAVEALKHGNEISIILFDLDNFGLINKNHGHVAGDNALKQVAAILKQNTDSREECACRYGGDEFAIVSIRSHDDAQALADTLSTGIADLVIPAIPEGISGSYGIAGGRRSREREDVHYLSTIDNLVTRASKECMAKKRKKMGEIPQGRQPLPDGESEVVVSPVQSEAGALSSATTAFVLDNVTISNLGSLLNVTVAVSCESIQYVHEISAYAAEGKSVMRMVADATAGALSKSMPEGEGIVVEDILTSTTPKQQMVISVVVMSVSTTGTKQGVGSVLMDSPNEWGSLQTVSAGARAVLAAWPSLEL